MVDSLFYASDYFEQLYQLAVKLIEKGRAYVDSLSEEEIREYRGDFYKKGKPSPYREPPDRREPGPVPPHARRASSPRARTCCAPRSISRRRT